MVASLLSLIAGAALVGVSLKRHVFERVLGPTVSAQYKLWRRFPRFTQSSEASYVDSSRVMLLGIGALLLVMGIGGIGVLVTG